MKNIKKKNNIADMLREAVKKAFNEGDTYQHKMVVLPAQQVIDICCENDKLKERNYWLESEHEYQCEKSYFEGVKESEKKEAKEILQELYDQIDENTPKWVGEQIKIIAKRYGVEVE